MPAKKNDVLTDAVNQWEDLESEKSILTEQQKALLDGLAAQGYNKKYVRAVLGRRKKDRRDVLEADEAINAMEMQLGMTFDAAE